MNPTPLDIELQFDSLPSDGLEEVYELNLFDYTQSGAYVAVGSVRLKPFEQIPSIGMSAAHFVQSFATPGSLGQNDGLVFGMWLEEWLFPSNTPTLIGHRSGLRSLWDRVLHRANLEVPRRPVRLQVSLPEIPKGGGSDTRIMSELPFELLARNGEFLFRRHGWSVVRCFRELEGRDAELPSRSRIGVVWANPGNNNDRLPEELFVQHEAVVANAAAALNLDLIPPLRHATRIAFNENVGREGAVDVVSIVAHGTPGCLWLHQESHALFPNDPGEPVPAADVAEALRKGRVKVAFLWSCHTAQGHAVLGSVARAALTTGECLAVVASRVALRADTTPVIAKSLLESLATNADGSLEHALSESRGVLPMDDLQWAAPLYYARPRRGQTVSFERPPEPEPSVGPWALLGAPDLTPYFQGRDEDIARCAAAVRTTRLVTLTGLPGAGKSELARAVAERVGAAGHRSIDRAIWINLTSVGQVSGVRGRIATQLHFNETTNDGTLALQLVDQRLVIILDNAEDLILADSSGFQRLVAAILSSAPDVRFLLTSRLPLGDPLPGLQERELRVDCLQPPSDKAVFVAAAEARLTDEQRASSELDGVVSMLGGHPRSLVLVASQVGRGMSLRTIRQRLEDDTVDAVVAHELIGTSRLSDRGDDAERAKRLAGGLRLAFTALERDSPRGAELFRWLGVLPAGMPGVLVDAVFGRRAEECVAVLLRHSMVAIAGPERRLLLPAPLRWFAKQKLGEMPEADRDRLLKTTLETWRNWLASLHVHLLGTPETRRALRVAAEETENLQELGEELLERKPEASAFLDAVAIWSGIQQFDGREADALAFLVDWMSKVDSHGLTVEKASKARVLQTRGSLQFRTRLDKEAEESYNAALSIFRAVGDRLAVANTLKALGDVQFGAGALLNAEKSYVAALKLSRTNRDRLGEASTLLALAELDVRTERMPKAEKNYGLALSIYRNHKHSHGVANTLLGLGELQEKADRLKDAENSFRSALPIYDAINDRLGQANTLKALGRLQIRINDLQEARKSLDDALGLHRALHKPLGEASVLQGLGELETKLRRMKEASALFAAALEIQNKLGDIQGRAGTLGYMARAARDFNEPERAVVLAGECWELCANLNYAWGEFHALQEIGIALNMCKDETWIHAWYLVTVGREPLNIQIDDGWAAYFATAPGFGKTAPKELASRARTILKQAIAKYRAKLQNEGIDPFAL